MLKFTIRRPVPSTALSSLMTSPRIFHDSVLLNGGQVLLSGGENVSNGSSVALITGELYYATTLAFKATPGNMLNLREHQTATLLNDGTVLEAGGTDGTNIFNTAEIYITSQLTGLERYYDFPCITLNSLRDHNCYSQQRAPSAAAAHRSLSSKCCGVLRLRVYFQLANDAPGRYGFSATVREAFRERNGYS